MYAETLLFVLMIFSIAVFVFIGALKFIDYLKRKSQENKKERKND